MKIISYILIILFLITSSIIFKIFIDSDLSIYVNYNQFWSTFLGAIVAGGFTLLAVFLTIKSQNTINEKNIRLSVYPVLNIDIKKKSDVNAITDDESKIYLYPNKITELNLKLYQNYYLYLIIENSGNIPIVDISISKLFMDDFENDVNLMSKNIGATQKYEFPLIMCLPLDEFRNEVFIDIQKKVKRLEDYKQELNELIKINENEIKKSIPINQLILENNHEIDMLTTLIESSSIYYNFSDDYNIQFNITYKDLLKNTYHKKVNITFYFYYYTRDIYNVNYINQILLELDYKNKEITEGD